MPHPVVSGGLFGHDFLSAGIVQDETWPTVDEAELIHLKGELERVFEAFPAEHKPNEQQTEDDLIWKIFAILGWNDHLRQQNLSVSGRDDVPDGLLFLDAATKAKANAFGEEWKRYELGAALVESKRWDRPLDRRSGRRGEELAPSTQMLRYLRRVDDITNGNLRWGILTNGGRWRLYWQGARSVSEQFFELDLASLLGVHDKSLDLFALDADEQLHWLKVFVLIFGREAFVPGIVDRRTFHERALAQARFFEERTAKDLSGLVFEQVFPLLVRSIADASAGTSLQDAREAALILLYRLLFVLYAEDRDLLPANDARYDDYGLRRVRMDVKRRKDEKDTFSTSASRYWAVLDDLCRAIDRGDASIGLPPYNGGLFTKSGAPMLADIRLADSVMADVVDLLSFNLIDGERRYINYRDLSVQQLGSIYERLLEYEVVRDADVIRVRPNLFARKGSGSYYTPEDLVGLIIRQTLDPLVERTSRTFVEKALELQGSDESLERQTARLRRLDPAERLLDLKVCDPAMGSGHFLVSLVDYLTDRVIAAIAEAETAVPDAEYVSPLVERIGDIRATILANAEDGGWIVDEEQLDDRHIVRRMVLKRCVYGVDKNAMAVELAKVALWLSSFTVGAPLSFLDHHLRHGDSLFGSFVRNGLDAAQEHGSPLLLREPIKKAVGSAAAMKTIEQLPDAEIAESERSAQIFEGVRASVAPLDTFLAYVHALEWLGLKGKDNKAAIQSFFDGEFGDVFEIASGTRAPQRPGTGKAQEQATGKLTPEAKLELFTDIHASVRELIGEEAFLNWQVAFPGVWDEWEDEGLHGGFDAVIGNPPWDRMKLQEVEWFEARDPAIAHAARAADRKKLIAKLKKTDDPLHADYIKAAARAVAGVRVARRGGDYPLLSGGDLNLYSLFVERALTLVKSDGMVGLLVPSGIASDKSASRFFRSVATEGRLKALFDFENRRTRHELEPFFPSVDSRFKFAAFIASPSPTDDPADCAFFLQSVDEVMDENRRFSFSASDFEAVNPNTGTAPILRSRRDAELVRAIYANAAVLVDRRTDPPTKLWPVRYSRMLDMTNDSRHFRTLTELQDDEKAYAKGGNLYRSAAGDWLPLYVGRMIHQFDHRAASVEVNLANLHRPVVSVDVSDEEKEDASFVPVPHYWVAESAVEFPKGMDWTITFRNITSATNVRTMVAAAAPRAGFGNSVPVLLPSEIDGYRSAGALLLGNLNAVAFDYASRSKTQTVNLNWFIVEQLPFVSSDRFDTVAFGPKTAGEIVREIVVRLTYTAHDMAGFARDNGYVDAKGDVLPPIVWDAEERLRLRAKLDAVFFHLYGITDRADIAYIYSTFPIQERHETRDYDRYMSRDLCLEYINILAAGQPDDEPVLTG